MSSKQGFCDSCHQNKPHRRTAGVFSFLNLILLGFPSLFGISTWRCTHCSTTCVFLTRQREITKSISRSSSSVSYSQLRPNAGASSKTVDPPKVKSTRSRLYSDKYRDGVVQRIVSGITSITEVKESLGLLESEVVDWIKQSFQRKEDRVEKLREALVLYQKDNPDFDVERIVSDAKRSGVIKAAKARSIAVESLSAESPSTKPGPNDDGPMHGTFNRLKPFVESGLRHQG